jgi:ABC-type xylose transport system permease subunit
LFLSSSLTAAAGAAGASAFGASGTATGAGFGASLLQALNNRTARLAMASESFIYFPED